MTEFPIIEVRDLIKRFGSKTVLRELNFQAGKCEFVALMGPNGSGKTTFLRILACISKPAAGFVRIAGLKLPQQAISIRHRIGFVSHQPLLYGDLTALENLRFYARIYSVSEPRKRIAFILNLVGLELRQHDLVRTYSRGMQQRLAIGRAFLHDPEVMLFDEPYTGLDQEACEMLDGVLRQVAGLGRTVVLTSHDLTRTVDLANRFDVLSGGRITASIAKKDLPPEGLLEFYRRAVALPPVVNNPKNHLFQSRDFL